MWRIVMDPARATLAMTMLLCFYEKGDTTANFSDGCYDKGTR